MNFLYPYFLISLAALAIPVIIHLFNFRRYKVVQFTNVKFLKELKEETDSKSKLKHLLVLLSRILFIAFLVLAFSQPYIPVTNNAVSKPNANIGIYIDNSFSMNAMEDNLTLLQHAKIKAEQIAAAHGNSANFYLVTNDFEVKHQQSFHKDEVKNSVQSIEQSVAVKKFDEIIKWFKQNSQNAAGGNTLYVISDFQKTLGNPEGLKADSNINIVFIPVRAEALQNIYIDSVWLEEPVKLSEPASLFIKINNSGDETVENARLTLKINNRIKSIAEVTIPSGKGIKDTLAFTLNTGGWQTAEVSINDFPVVYDDKYYLAINVPEFINVEILNESGENPFLNNVFAGSKVFRVSNRNSRQPDYTAISKSQVVILNGLKDISTGLSSELVKYVKQGGKLIIFPAADANIASYNSFLKTISADQLLRWKEKEQKASYINLEDEMFKDIFEGKSSQKQAMENMELPIAKKSFELSADYRTSAVPLLKFSEGALLNKYTIGKGLLYLFTVPVEMNASNLPVHPLFLPIMHQAASQQNVVLPASFTLGSAKNIEIEDVSIDAENILKVRGNGMEFIPQQRKVSGKVFLNIHDQIKTAGIYEAFFTEQDKITPLAMNYDRLESDMIFWNDQQLRDAAKEKNIKLISNEKKNLSIEVNEMNTGIILWKLCLIFALVFLAIEILLLKFLK